MPQEDNKPKTQKTKYSFVYFITDGHGHIKIGKADDTSQRIKELQTGNPYKLSFLLTVILPSVEEAFDLEQELHSIFDDYRMEGEWFEEPPVLELIDTDVVNLGRFSFGGLQFGRALK